MAMKKQGIVLLLCLVMAACGATAQPPPSATPAGAAAAQPATATAVPASSTSRPRPGDIHRAEGGDRWYPADPAKLLATVQAYTGQAEVAQSGGRLLGIIVPHAGYLYSGAVAGHAFRAVQEAGCAQQTIVVIGDTHTGNGSAQIAVWESGAFETPLGWLPVDEAVAQALVAADPLIQADRKAFRSEHPVENQLPFIQVVCPGARIVPIVIRQPSLKNAQALAQALVTALDGRPALIVASTDLSHYHAYKEARAMDEVALQSIVSLDPQVVADSPRRCAELGLGSGDPLTMCSQGAVMTALLASREMGANQASVLYYANSGDVPIGDPAQVVGYGAVALWQTSGETDTPDFAVPALPPEPQEPLALPPEAQKELLALARRTAAQFLITETFPVYETEDPALLQRMGAYVTYEEPAGESGAGQPVLRGCVGRLEGDRPAYLNVQYAAVAAALIDSRFPPITPEELETLTLEITLLHPMRQVESPDEIQIGQDGILMQVGAKGGALYLPQVPVEQGWDLPTTLVHLCQKAGMADDCWQQKDARFEVFSGQWFGEEE
jgi:AmmeMemoRadiSam system protein B/AmmeMemoRadiSam system protein A